MVVAPIESAGFARKACQRSGQRNIPVAPAVRHAATLKRQGHQTDAYRQTARYCPLERLPRRWRLDKTQGPGHRGELDGSQSTEENVAQHNSLVQMLGDD